MDLLVGHRTGLRGLKSCAWRSVLFPRMGARERTRDSKVSGDLIRYQHSAIWLQVKGWIYGPSERSWRATIATIKYITAKRIV